MHSTVCPRRAKGIVGSLLVGATLLCTTASAARNVDDPAPLVMVSDYDPGEERTMFAWRPPDSEDLRPEIADRKWVVGLVFFFLHGSGATLWGPVLMGAPFDMEWAVPSIVWLVVQYLSYLPVMIPYLNYVLWPITLVGVWGSAWIGMSTTITNLNREGVPLGYSAPPSRSARRRRAPGASDAEDDEGAATE